MNTPLTGKLAFCGLRTIENFPHAMMDPYICLVQAGRWPGGREPLTSPQAARMHFRR